MLVTVVVFFLLSAAMHAGLMLIGRQLPEESADVTRSMRWTLQFVLTGVALFYPGAFVPEGLVDATVGAPRMSLSDYSRQRNDLMGVRLELHGTIEWVDDYPMGQGAELPLWIRMQQGTGAVEVVCDGLDFGASPRAGDRIVAIGQQQKWTGSEFFIASSCRFDDDATDTADTADTAE